MIIVLYIYIVIAITIPVHMSMHFEFTKIIMYTVLAALKNKTQLYIILY